jgi:hypothetical protein
MSTKTHLALLLTGMAWACGSAVGAEMSADQRALLKEGRVLSMSKLAP